MANGDLTIEGNIGIQVIRPNSPVEILGPLQYVSGSLTATQSGTVVTGQSGVLFTTAMIGHILQFADGIKARVAGITSSTQLTVENDDSRTFTTGQIFAIYYPGFTVDSNANAMVHGDLTIDSWNINGMGGSTPIWDHLGTSVYLDNDANVLGIGTSTIPTNTKLHIEAETGKIGLRLALPPNQTSGNYYAPMLMFDATNYTGVDRVYWMRQEESKWFFNVSDTSLSGNQKHILTADSNGYLGIGVVAPTVPLEIYASKGPSSDIVIADNHNNHPVVYISEDSSGNGGLFIDTDAGNENIALNSNSSVASYINAGNVGIGQTSPTAKLDVSGSTGYDQLRLEHDFTPTGTSDSHGHTGDIAWDVNYVYVKTGSGWKRSGLSTF